MHNRVMDSMHEPELLTLASGRRVAVYWLARGGDPQQAVVFRHGAPGAGNLDPDPPATAAREVTLIGIDWPGYWDRGLAHFAPGRYFWGGPSP